MVDILSCPLEILEFIVNGLERGQLVDDNSQLCWPMHSRASTQDIRNIRLVHSKLRDAAWLAFGRVLGSSVFTITPISLANLMAIANHKELHNKVTTLTLSRASLATAPNPHLGWWTGRPPRAPFQRKRPDNFASQSLTSQLFDKDPEGLDRDRAILHAAWDAAVEHHEKFCAAPANQHETFLATIFQKLTNLRHLRKAYRWEDHHTKQVPKLWLRMELSDKMLASERYLLDRYEVHEGYSQNYSDQLETTVEVAVRKSGVRFESILGFHTELIPKDLKQELACLDTFPRASITQQPPHYHLDDLCTSPLLKELHVDFWGCNIEGWFNLVKQPVALDLLDIKDMCLTEEALIALISPTLKKLRLSRIDLCIPHFDESEEGYCMLEAPWSDLLHDIAESSDLKVLELDEIGNRACLEMSYATLHGVAAKVAFVAFRACGKAWNPWEGFHPSPDIPQVAMVFVNGEEVYDGPNTTRHLDSRMGLWKGARFGLPSNMKHCKDEKTGKLVYEETDRLVGVV